MYDPNATLYEIGSHHGDYKVVVSDTHNCSAMKYFSSFVDPPGLGAGNTKTEALLSLAESLDTAANAIREFVNKQEAV